MSTLTLPVTSTTTPVASRRGLALRRTLVGAILAIFGPSLAAAQDVGSGDAMWIWSGQLPPGPAPSGDVYFRKKFSCNSPESARIEITCDDRYELYVNGRLVGNGQNWQRMDVYNVLGYVRNGMNVVAVKASNLSAGSAGLAVRVSVRNKGNTDVSHSTDNSWRSSLEAPRHWQQPNFSDNDWPPARVMGELGRTAPWGDQVQMPQGGAGGRFRIAPDFRVERVVEPELAGSIVAMAFNEAGNLIVSRERGPLYLVSDDDRNGVFETAKVYCEEVKNCQGILPLNGSVFAVGEMFHTGDEGEKKDGEKKTVALFLLEDADRDGKAEKQSVVFKFKGGMGEHGPHAPVLGPDGLIYLVIGNHASAEVQFEPTSPHLRYYEGDLVQPKYEDAGGHAHGLKAPGGVVIRTDVTGSFVELFSGGFRNAYDIAFNRQGDLFSYDSDMEWDVGLPWYRPTRVNHLIPGAELGWRSGWSKWPSYFVDSLPATADIGRGSPTGVEFYNHQMFPARYHNALFAADWSMGRIVAVRLRAENGSYVARSEVFLQGRPLNVTDLAVGPDGWLYFSTGGRGTEGGVYRIRWQGQTPPQPRHGGLMAAIKQPQLYSAWGRNRVANVKQQVGEVWDSALVEMARDKRAPVDDRVRAFDLMQLVGPFPTPNLLVEASRDGSPELRHKAAYLMGIHADGATGARLVQLLEDEHPNVQRQACESLTRAGQTPPVEKLLPLLASPHRFLAWGARRALERVPREQWAPQVLSAENPRVFLIGALALLFVDPDRETIDRILARCSETMQGFLEDDDFLALLRVVQVALTRSDVTGDDVAQLRGQLAEEYPSLDWRMNRELVRLLVAMQESSIIPRLMTELANPETPVVEKLHAATHARFLQQGWEAGERLELLKFLEYARTLPGGHSFKGYMDNVNRDFVSQMADDDLGLVLDNALDMPTACLSVLRRLPERPDDALLDRLIKIDREIKTVDSEAARTLGTGIVAILGTSRTPASMAYLREAFDRDPVRREDLAMGLAQEPHGENFPYLLKALPIVEGAAAQEVLTKLAEVDAKPDDAESLRQTILSGLKLQDIGAALAVGVLEKWTGEKRSQPEDKWDAALASWQQWFAETFPSSPPAVLPTNTGNKYTLQELLDFVKGPGGAQANAGRGEQVFVKAQCVKCHRYGARGEGLGPDLTSVAQRFQKKEILESVLYPSLVISDQYVSKTIATTDGLTYSGIVDPSREDALVVLQSNGQKQVVPKDQIEQISPSNKSAMPEGLFDDLTLEEIADLLAYLNRPQSGR